MVAGPEFHQNFNTSAITGNPTSSPQYILLSYFCVTLEQFSYMHYSF